jgi:hypothetical protein
VRYALELAQPKLVGTVPTVPAFILRSVRAVRVLARDGRIPRSLRWFVAAGLLPVPGPFDEAVLLIAAAILFAFYREPIRDAWRQAQPERFANQASR